VPSVATGDHGNDRANGAQSIKQALFRPARACCSPRYGRMLRPLFKRPGFYESLNRSHPMHSLYRLKENAPQPAEIPFTIIKLAACLVASLVAKRLSKRFDEVWPARDVEYFKKILHQGCRRRCISPRQHSEAGFVSAAAGDDEFEENLRCRVNCFRAAYHHISLL